MTNEAREAPYLALAARMARIAWPRTDTPRCRSAGAATALLQRGAQATVGASGADCGLDETSGGEPAS